MAGNNDIFQRTPAQLKGVFRADDAVLTWNNGAPGNLVQQLNFQYSQNVTRLFDIADAAAQYYVGGRTQGQATVNRVIGPAGSAVTFYTAFGDVCKSNNRPISLKLSKTDCSGQNNAQPTTYTMLNTVITQVGIGVAAQDMIIGENLTIMYTTLTAV